MVLDFAEKGRYVGAAIKKIHGGICMSQITIRQIQDNIDNRIRQLSREHKRSLNKTIIALLEEALGISENPRRKRDLSQLAGTWDDEYCAEFERNIAHFDTIDPEIWKV